MKKYRLIAKITSFALILMMLFSICSINGIVAYAEGVSDSDSIQESEKYVTNNVSNKEQSEIKKYKTSIEDFIEPILGNRTIANCEYMYNLDGSTDYICVEFNGGGYAIFAKETMEMMEYNPIGDLPYDNVVASKYYAGPASYLYKSGNNEFVNAVSGEKIAISDAEIARISEKTREKIVIPDALKYDINLSEFSAKNLNEQDEDNERGSSGTGLVPGNWIFASSFGSYIIPNGDYFLADPTIGRNYDGEVYANENSNTCGPIAAQLLLGYHNYVNDRRIIEDRFLNGYDDTTGTVTDHEKNPNYCEDPMYMDQYTTGTNSASTGANSFYCEIISRIMDPCQSSSTITEIKDGITSYLNDQISSSGYSIEYQLPSSTHINYTVIRNKLNRNTPVIIRLDNDFTISDESDPQNFEHTVVAYGYHNYSYPDSPNIARAGYIVHFGWQGTGYECVWVNALWCNAYISVDINHEHSYATIGAIPNTETHIDIVRTEYKCTVCGHRTDAALTIGPNEQYREEQIYIPMNGRAFRDFYLTVPYTGRYLIQTFGNENATMTLYDTDYNQLRYNEDSGAESNALFTQSFTAGEHYILRVTLHTKADTGYVKLGITPISEYYLSYEEISNMTGTDLSYHFTSELSKAKVITFTPTQTGTYTFRTGYNSEQVIDTCLYFIIPRSSGECFYDDNSGGDMQASITMGLTIGKTYFIVVAARHFSTVSGPLKLSIKLQQ